MKSKELQERFTRMAAGRIPVINDGILFSDDRITGIPLPFKEERYICLGKHRLNRKLEADINIEFTPIFHLNAHILYRSMKVLRRRNHIELGLYIMDKGRAVFMARNGESGILMAPRYRGSEETSEKYIPVKTYIPSFHTRVLKNFDRWCLIATGQRNGGKA